MSGSVGSQIKITTSLFMMIKNNNKNTQVSCIAGLDLEAVTLAEMSLKL